MLPVSKIYQIMKESGAIAVSNEGKKTMVKVIERIISKIMKEAEKIAFSKNRKKIVLEDVKEAKKRIWG